MDLPRVLFAGPEFPAAPDHLRRALFGASITSLPSTHTAGLTCTAEVLIPLMAPVDGEFLDRVEGLRLVQQWGAGLEGIDEGAASSRGIAVGNVSSAISKNADSVAEWCVMAALALSRGLGVLEQAIRKGEVWGAPIGQSLAGKTAGIIGFGSIGSALARCLAAFSMDLVAITAHPVEDRARTSGLRWLKGPDALFELLGASDYVFVCLPLTSDTALLIDDDALANIRPGARLINPGRGGLVDEEALLRALDDRRISGAGLDVFSTEPLDPRHVLLQHPNVLATPHIAGVTDTSYEGIATQVAAIVRRLAAHEPLEHCVNWEEVKDGFYETRP